MAPTLMQMAALGLPLLAVTLAWLRPSAPAPFSAEQIENFHIKHYLTNDTIRSWEEGAWTQALLEVHNPELTIFAHRPFPGGRLPQIPRDLSTVPGLSGAASYIQVNGTLLCDGGGSPADPASLGTQAILLSMRESTELQSSLPSPAAFADAAKRQVMHLMHDATTFALNATHSAISHRDEPPELWGDFIYMVPPFLAYYGVATRSLEFLETAVQQCQLYNDALVTNVTLLNGTTCSGLWRHIISQPKLLPGGVCCTDPFVWLTSNAWAIAGMVRVMATLDAVRSINVDSWSGNTSWNVEDAYTTLTDLVTSMLDCMMTQARDNDTDLLRNYLDGPEVESSGWTFGDAAGTSLVTSAVYRLAVLRPHVFRDQKYVAWADRNLLAVARHVHEDGRVGPVAQINGVPSTKAVESTSEGQSMGLLLYAARRDFLESKRWFRWSGIWY